MATVAVCPFRSPISYLAVRLPLAYHQEINAQQFIHDRSRRSREVCRGKQPKSFARSSLDGCRRPQDFARSSGEATQERARSSLRSREYSHAQDFARAKLALGSFPRLWAWLADNRLDIYRTYALYKMAVMCITAIL